MFEGKISAKILGSHKAIWKFSYCPEDHKLRMEYYDDINPRSVCNSWDRPFLNPKYSLRIPVTPETLARIAGGEVVPLEMDSEWHVGHIKQVYTFESTGYSIRLEQLINAASGLPYHFITDHYRDDPGLAEEYFAFLNSIAETTKSEQDYWAFYRLYLGEEWSPKVYAKFCKLMKKFAELALISY